MKKVLLFIPVILMLLLINETAISQVTNKKIYKTWISPMNVSAPLIEGYVTATKDSSIIVSDFFENSELGNISRELNVKNIKVIEYRRRGQIWKSALAVAAAGALVGFIVGQNTIHEDEDKLISLHGLERLYLTAGATGGGALIGAMFGSIKIKIPINGSQEIYLVEKKKSKLFNGFK